MKRSHLALVFVFAMSIQLARGAEAPAVIDRPGADDDLYINSHQ